MLDCTLSMGQTLATMVSDLRGLSGQAGVKVGDPYTAVEGRERLLG